MKGQSGDSDDYFKEVYDEHEQDYQDREKDYNPIQMIQIHPAEEVQRLEPVPAYTGVESDKENNYYSSEEENLLSEDK